LRLRWTKAGLGTVNQPPRPGNSMALVRRLLSAATSAFLAVCRTSSRTVGSSDQCLTCRPNGTTMTDRLVTYGRAELRSRQQPIGRRRFDPIEARTPPPVCGCPLGPPLAHPTHPPGGGPLLRPVRCLARPPMRKVSPSAASPGGNICVRISASRRSNASTASASTST
jgi:hypothetical protein